MHLDNSCTKLIYNYNTWRQICFLILIKKEKGGWVLATCLFTGLRFIESNMIPPLIYCFAIFQQSTCLLLPSSTLLSIFISNSHLFSWAYHQLWALLSWARPNWMGLSSMTLYLKYRTPSTKWQSIKKNTSVTTIKLYWWDGDIKNFVYLLSSHITYTLQLRLDY